jgi:hypothetical protein
LVLLQPSTAASCPTSHNQFSGATLCCRWQNFHMSNCPTSKLSDFQIVRLPNCPTSKWSDFQMVRLPNCPTSKLSPLKCCYYLINVPKQTEYYYLPPVVGCQAGSVI